MQSDRGNFTEVGRCCLRISLSFPLLRTKQTSTPRLETTPFVHGAPDQPASAVDPLSDEQDAHKDANYIGWFCPAETDASVLGRSVTAPMGQHQDISETDARAVSSRRRNFYVLCGGCCPDTLDITVVSLPFRLLDWSPVRPSVPAWCGSQEYVSLKAYDLVASSKGGLERTRR